MKSIIASHNKTLLSAHIPTPTQQPSNLSSHSSLEFGAKKATNQHAPCYKAADHRQWAPLKYYFSPRTSLICNKSYILQNKSYIFATSGIFYKTSLIFPQQVFYFTKQVYISATSRIFYKTSLLNPYTSVFVRFGAPYQQRRNVQTNLLRLRIGICIPGEKTQTTLNLFFDLAVVLLCPIPFNSKMKVVPFPKLREFTAVKVSCAPG